ncbi:calmodulin-binding transcription activator 1 isoform X7 [Esox lucius]|nr:calmodulin-binding transcription activator 1 isoform X7 [Esox lucius]
MILYNRKKVKYRKDGYCWKKRKDGKTTREDHMKLKVQGVECLYGCYVHSSIIPTFHRRCYWLLQNPDIVLVHYLNVPAIEDCGKPCGPILCSINTDKKEWAKWTKEELIGQLKPMFHGIKWTCSNGNSSSGFSVEQLVQQILDSHQTKPPPRTHNCLCTGTLGAGSSVHHKCNSAKHRIISPKVEPRGGYSSAHSEVQNNDVSEGKTEHSGHGGGGGGKSSGGGGGGSAREKRNGKVPKPVLLHQNSTEVSSTNQVEVPDTTQNSPVSISSGLNSDPDMADSPVVTGMGHVASVMSGLSQSVFMSEVTGDPVYSMSPTGGPNAHLMGPDGASQGLVLSGVVADSHKFAFPGGGTGERSGGAGGADGLSMLSAAGVSEELVLSSSLDAGGLKIPETTMNFDPDCFLNNPKQGQTYGGSGLKGDSSSSSSTNSTNSSLQRSPSMSDSVYSFNSALVKNIKTEDTSFEQQLAKEQGYQVGAGVSCGGGVSGSSGSGSSQGSLGLTPAGSLLPSGGGLSPSTTLEQMDFSAIDAKQDYSSGAGSVGYGQAMNSPHLSHQSRSPSFFLQDTQQPSQAQQGRSSMGQKAHMMEHNSHDSTAYMGLQVVKTDSPGSNGHLHHHHQSHQGQHRTNCNGGSPTEGSGQGPGSLQLLQYQGSFPEEVVGLEQTGSVGQGQAGRTDNGEGLLKPEDHLQACGGGNAEGGGTEHYLQQANDGGGAGGGQGGGGGGEGVTMSNGNGVNNDGSSRSQTHQLQPLLQGAGMVQGLYTTVGPHQGLGGTGSNGGAGGAGMEISLDHFDISFGNQFSDLINDFISVDGSGANMAAGGALYTHQLVASHGSDGQSTSSGVPQQGQEEGGVGGARAAGYSPSELCLQPCCSPQSLGGGSGAGGTGAEQGSLAYMHVAEVVSAAVAQGTLGMLQATGRLFMVTDYSPEWSYPEGGVKVLITGPWQEASSNYSCLFDQISVPASLIQPGVLRCYCPAHDTGLVTLQVSASNQIISNSVVFEYKARALPSLPSSQHDWLSLDDNQFRMSILERLEQMERRMAEMASHHQQGSGGGSGTGGGAGGAGGGGGGNTSQTQCVSGQGQAGSSFESRVVVVCEKMMNRACWAKSKHLIHSKTFRGMTLLHLAAGQGYATLIQTLIKWRTKHADSLDLELEVDPLNVDHFSCTPLMWACALGHLEAAVVLYKWDRRALAIPDSLGRLPLSIARSRGHTKLAECLEQLQREEQQPPAPLPPATRMSFSPTPHDAPTSDSWMVTWAGDSVMASGGKKGCTATTTTTTTSSTNLNPDLRRPRSEPSNYYSSECQRDLPLAKKHKPNPELFQARPDKAMSVPLSLEQQQLHKLPFSPKSLSHEGLSPDKSHASGGSAGGAGGAKWSSREGFSGGGSGRKVSGSSGGSSLGKEKLASRLRQREQLGNMLVMADREMVDTELLPYREDLENQDCMTQMDDLQVNMMTLAEHIIEATPDRIKRDNFVPMDGVPLDTTGVSSTMSWLASYLGDVEHLPSIIHLRSLYNEPLTPSSNPSLSPGNSPLREGPIDRPTLPSPADWSEFIQASNSKVERDLAQLTLSDPEQRELYEAARLVQTAFRKYKGRPFREQQEVAAAVIQRCYKKYKQLTWIALKYALYKKMTQAAILIQSKFRSYHEQKKFQQSRRAAVLIQQYYRSYKEFGRLRPHRRGAALVQHKLRSSLLTKRQDQAARKIMRFLRRCRHSPLMDHRLFKRSERIEKGQGT